MGRSRGTGDAGEGAPARNCAFGIQIRSQVAEVLP